MQTRAAPPNIGSLAAQLLGPQGFAGERLAQAEERLRTRRSWSPPQDFRAFHWHQRPTPPRPPPELSRTVRPRDIVGWANARAARAAHAGCQGDWRAAFRGYIVASQLLQLVLESDEPTQELRDETRRQMAELLDTAEALKQLHPENLLLSTANTEPEVAIGRAWADIDVATAAAAAAHAVEENLAGNTELKSGRAAAAAERYTRSLELDDSQPHVYGNRSVAYLRTDDMLAALRDAREAVNRDPESVARRAGVALRRGLLPGDQVTAAQESAGQLEDVASEEQRGEEMRRKFAQEVAVEVAELRSRTLTNEASMRLLEFAELGDSEGALRAIGEGAEVDVPHPGWLDYTPLHMAAMHGHLELARLLLYAGATVGSIAQDGAAPLHLAGSGAMAVLLAEHEPGGESCCQSRDLNGDTPAQRLQLEQGWAQELLYEEGDLLVCRPQGSPEVAATAAAVVRCASGDEGGSDGEAAISLLGAALSTTSIEVQHFRLCRVCERVVAPPLALSGGQRREHNGPAFYVRWFDPEGTSCSGVGSHRRATATTYYTPAPVLELVDRSAVLLRFRAAHRGQQGSFSLAGGGIRLRGTGGQHGATVVAMAGTPLRSLDDDNGCDGSGGDDDTQRVSPPQQQLVLTPDEWHAVNDAVLGPVRQAVAAQRQALAASDRAATQILHERHAMFELLCVTSPSFATQSTGTRCCLLMADGRLARLPPGAIVVSVAAVAHPPSSLMGPKAMAAAASISSVQGAKRRQQQRRQQQQSEEAVMAAQLAPEDEGAASLAAREAMLVDVAAEERARKVDIGLLAVTELIPHRPEQAQLFSNQQHCYSAEMRAKVDAMPAALNAAGAPAALGKGLSYQRLNSPNGVVNGWGASRALPPPLSPEGFKEPTQEENFVTLSLHGPAEENCAGGVSVAVRFLQDSLFRYYM